MVAKQGSKRARRLAPSKTKSYVFKQLERWQSGRSHRTRNAAYGQPYRGFESLPLRHALLAARKPTAKVLKLRSVGGKRAARRKTAVGRVTLSSLLFFLQSYSSASIWRAGLDCFFSGQVVYFVNRPRPRSDDAHTGFHTVAQGAIEKSEVMIK